MSDISVKSLETVFIAVLYYLLFSASLDSRAIYYAMNKHILASPSVTLAPSPLTSRPYKQVHQYGHRCYLYKFLKCPHHRHRHHLSLGTLRFLCQATRG